MALVNYLPLTYEKIDCAALVVGLSLPGFCAGFRAGLDRKQDHFR
jgi:hypothetical protein